MAGGRPGSGARDPVGVLLVRSREEPEAFGELYDRCGPDIRAWFLRRTRSGHLAMELSAETFAQALASLHRYDPAAGTGWSWLFGIATHQYARLVRDGSVRARYRDRVQMVTPTITPDDVDRVIALVDAQHLAPQLQAALGELTDGVRAAVELRVGHDLPYAEVAARLGVTEGNARVRVRRGLQQLTLALVGR